MFTWVPVTAAIPGTPNFQTDFFHKQIGNMSLHQILRHAFAYLLKMQEYNCSKQWLIETIFETFYGPLSHCLLRLDT